MEWERGELIGRGSFSTVHIGTTSNFDLIAVKASPFSDGARLIHEKSVLEAIGGHRNIIGCIGADVTFENFKQQYNLLLEYAEGGSLADRLRKSGGKMNEDEVRNYARQMLKGLAHLHERGFAHLDVKPSNLLLTESGVLKIADFGLAERVTGEARRKSTVGTPMFMAPESVNGGRYGPSCDVWAAGCSVSELATGLPPWTHRHGDADCASVLFRIGFGNEIPAIPDELSEEGKDFLRKCFVKDPRKRWTTDMLMNHPFVSNKEEESERFVSVSPRCVFEFPGGECCGDSIGSVLFPDVPVSASNSALERVRELSSDWEEEWTDDGRWIRIRD